MSPETGRRARRPAIAREPRGPARPSSARGPAGLPATVGWPTARLPRDPRLAAELAGAGVDLLRATWFVLPGRRSLSVDLSGRRSGVSRGRDRAAGRRSAARRFRAPARRLRAPARRLRACPRGTRNRVRWRPKCVRRHPHRARQRWGGQDVRQARWHCLPAGARSLRARVPAWQSGRRAARSSARTPANPGPGERDGLREHRSALAGARDRLRVQ